MTFKCTHLLKAFFLCLFILNGCATFIEYNPNFEEKNFEKATNRKLSLTLSVDYTYIHNEGIPTRDTSSGRNISEEIILVLNESQYFNEIKAGTENPDIRLEVKIWNRSSRNFLMDQLTGYTLFLIPSCSEDDVTMEFQFLNSKGIALKKYNRKVKFDTCVHLTLLPLTPFMDPYFSFYRGLRNVTQSVIQDSKKDAVLTL